VNDRSSAPNLSGTQRLPLGRWVLDLAAGELLSANGQPAALRKQALSVLLALGARAGQVVSKDDLARQVWPNVVVGEGSLTQAVVDIRRVLGDHDHRLVRNVARRGYMLVPSPGEEPASPPPAPSAPVSTAGSGPILRRQWMALAVALTVVLAAAFAVWSQRSPSLARPDDLSIVVLPLVAEGGGADIEAFADVLHNDLIAAASRFEGSTVIGRGTAATFRGRAVDPRTVARELNVRHVVSGSLRRDGERMRLTLTLIDGASGAQRWTEVFEVDRPLLGQALADAVAQLARALYIHAMKSAAVRADALSPSQVTADDLATRALGMWFRGLNRDNVMASLALAEQAVAIDPDSMRGWGAIATANVQALGNNWFVDAEARKSARLRADQASAELDRIAPDGFQAMQARVIAAYNRGDFPAMVQRSRLWVERHPHPVAYGALGAALNHTDQPEVAMPWFERALRLSPLDPIRSEWMYRLALSHYIAGNHEQALDWAQKAQATNPLLPWPPVQAAALVQLGRHAEAQASWDDFHRRHPAYDRAAVLRRLGGDFPRFAAARARLIADVGELGMK
jgi:TolB-like protein/DNA-binding winged helix-turn-helix (wHTH) protein